MKKLLMILILGLITTISNGQIAKYHSHLTNNAKYQSYIDMNNDTISVGDTIFLGQPSNNGRFLFITQGGKYVAAWLAGSEVIITKIRAYSSSRKRPPILFMQFKTYGLIPVYIQYDNALINKEIVLK